VRVALRHGEISGRDGLIGERVEELQTFLDLRNFNELVGLVGLPDAARAANDRRDVALLRRLRSHMPSTGNAIAGVTSLSACLAA